MRLKFVLRFFMLVLILLSVAQLIYTVRFTDNYSIAENYIKNTFLNNLMILVVVQFAIGAILFLFYDELKEFDELKKMKILEQRSRLEALYSVSSDGYLIVDLQGEVVSVSNLLRDYFPDVEEGANLLNATLGASSQKLKDYAAAVLEAKDAQEPIFYNMKKLELHFGLKSAVVRGANLEPLGFVIAVSIKGNTKRKDKKE